MGIEQKRKENPKYDDTTSSFCPILVFSFCTVGVGMWNKEVDEINETTSQLSRKVTITSRDAVLYCYNNMGVQLLSGEENCTKYF